MKGKQKSPHYAVRLIILIVFAGTVFFGSCVYLYRKGQIYTLMIFNYLRLSQDIRPAIMLEVNNWRSYGKTIYRRSAL